MIIDQYIVFIGARAPLSTELLSIEKRFAKAKIVAPAVKKKHAGNTEVAVKSASTKLYDLLSLQDSPSQKARLCIWMYEPTDYSQFELIWKTFGHASWVETVPMIYFHQITATVDYLHRRINRIWPLLHEISLSAYADRRSSPLALPLRNFTSGITRDLREYWYNNLDTIQINKRIKSFKSRYVQRRHKARQGFRDDKALIFKPATDGECHGKPHPTGFEHRSFFCGRFRFGVSLYPGFHFDVSPENNTTIQCNLRTDSGSIRLMRSEKRRYINIFPNDYLLPK